MRRFAVVAVLLGALGAMLTGCHRPSRGPGQEVTGMVLNPGVRLQTAQNMVIRAGDRAGGRYSFVFGPYLAVPKTSFEDPDLFAAGGVAPSFSAAAKQQSGVELGTMAVFSTAAAAQAQPVGTQVEETDVEVFQVDSGVGLFWGIRPKVKSRRVYIGGDGTEFMLYVEPATAGEATPEHIVLVNPRNTDRARVYKLDSAGQPTGDPIVLRPGSLYARLNPDGSFSQSATVPPEIQAVVEYAKQQAAAAGASH